MSKIKLSNIPLKKTKHEILDFLQTSNGAYYGDLVMELDRDTLTILEHLIELKKMGMVYKDHRGGKFRIREDQHIKRRRPPKALEEDKYGEWEVVEEMNQFSKKTRRSVKKVDNEISINKQVPGEQKVNHGDEDK